LREERLRREATCLGEARQGKQCRIGHDASSDIRRRSTCRENCERRSRESACLNDHNYLTMLPS
jgi:hypothetical protein